MKCRKSRKQVRKSVLAQCAAIIVRLDVTRRSWCRRHKSCSDYVQSGGSDIFLLQQMYRCENTNTWRLTWNSHLKTLESRVKGKNHIRKNNSTWLATLHNTQNFSVSQKRETVLKCKQERPVNGVLVCCQRNQGQSNKHSAGRSERRWAALTHCTKKNTHSSFSLSAVFLWGVFKQRKQRGWRWPSLEPKKPPLSLTPKLSHMQRSISSAYLRLVDRKWSQTLLILVCVLFLCLSQHLQRKESSTNISYVEKDTGPGDCRLPVLLCHWPTYPSETRSMTWCEEAWWGG